MGDGFVEEVEDSVVVELVHGEEDAVAGFGLWKGDFDVADVGGFGGGDVCEGGAFRGVGVVGVVHSLVKGGRVHYYCL